MKSSASTPSASSASSARSSASDCWKASSWRRPAKFSKIEDAGGEARTTGARRHQRRRNASSAHLRSGRPHRQPPDPHRFRRHPAAAQCCARPLLRTGAEWCRRGSTTWASASKKSASAATASRTRARAAVARARARWAGRRMGRDKAGTGTRPGQGHGQARASRAPDGQRYAPGTGPMSSGSGQAFSQAQGQGQGMGQRGVASLRQPALEAARPADQQRQLHRRRPRFRTTAARRASSAANQPRLLGSSDQLACWRAGRPIMPITGGLFVSVGKQARVRGQARVMERRPQAC